jgi:Kyanoviridae exonuclease
MYSKRPCYLLTAVMKLFSHVPLATPLPELQAETVEGKRHYFTPEGNSYPSITTVLSVLSQEAIEDWRERIGEDEASRICEHAASRGTDLHAVLEAYLKNEALIFPNDPKSRVKIMFNRMKRILAGVDNIIAQEVPLYSDNFTIAGRCDCIAEFDGVLSIVDFKSATKAKKKAWINGYFLQATGYSLMFEERTGIRVDQIVILMSGEEDFSCQVFVENRDKYIEPLRKVIERFQNETTAV